MSATPTSPTVTKETFRVEGLDTAFVLRRIRAIDKIEIGIQQSVLLRGISATSVNNEAAEFSYLLGCLKVALVEPADFRFEELEEEDAVDLWMQWDKWNRSFRKSRPTSVGPTR